MIARSKQLGYSTLVFFRRLIDAQFARWHLDQIFDENAFYSHFATGVWWSFIGAVISQGLSLLASVPVVRLLGPVGYGELGIIQSTLALFALFTGTSLGLTATKYVAELVNTDPDRTSRMIGLTMSSALLISAALALLLGIGAPFLSRNILNAAHLSPTLRIAALVIFLNGINGAQTGTLSGFQAFRRIAQINFFRGLVNFPIVLVGAWLWNVNGAIVALVITTGVGVILNHRALIQEITKHGLIKSFWSGISEWRVLVSFTLPAILSGIVVVPVTWWANIVLVNQNNGYSEMGIINATNLWRTALMFLPAVLTQPTLPLLSKLHGSGSRKEFRSLLNLNLAIVFLSTFIPASVISIASPWIMQAYGFEGLSVRIILVFMSFTAVLSALTAVIGSVISSKGKMWHGLGLNAIWSVAFILLFISREQNAFGLATAYLISYLVHFVTVSLYAAFSLRE